MSVEIKTDYEMAWVKFSDPTDAAKFIRYDAVCMMGRARWYRRAWRWFARVVLRRKVPRHVLKVTAVNQDTGVITVSSVTSD